MRDLRKITLIALCLASLAACTGNQRIGPPPCFVDPGDQCDR